MKLYTSEDVYKLTQRKMLWSKWHSFGGISGRLLKEAAPIISSYLDLSITKVIFHNDGKQAKTSPICNESHKNDPNSIAQFSHYRRLSKIIGKNVLNQLYMITWFLIIYCSNSNQDSDHFNLYITTVTDTANNWPVFKCWRWPC